MHTSFKLQFVAVTAALSTLVSGAPVAEPESGALVARAASTTYTNSAEFRRVMMGAHSFFRDQHGLAAVTWNADRARVADSFARKCVYKHSGTAGAGENIAIGFGDAQSVVNAWTSSERPKYNYAKPGFSSETGHFTQVVWRKSTSIGCGRALCNNRWFVVCQYSPQGNVLPASNFAANVPKQIKGSPSTPFVYKTSKRDALPDAEPEAEPEAEAQDELDPLADSGVDGEALFAPLLVGSE